MLKVESGGMSNPKFGLIIGTYGSVPYIHLFLESAKRNFPHVSVFVNDDCSGMTALQDICKNYNTTFNNNSHHHTHLPGDVAAIINGLNWAKTNLIDILAKMSRRFIPFFDWTIDLKRVFKYGSLVCGNHDTHYNLPLRTECFAMHVNSWHSRIREIERFKRVRGNPSRFVEESFFNLANSITNGKGITPWDAIGNNRKSPMPNILWHHSHAVEHYFNKSQEYNLPYSLQDFRKVN